MKLFPTGGRRSLKLTISILCMSTYAYVGVISHEFRPAKLGHVIDCYRIEHKFLEQQDYLDTNHSTQQRDILSLYTPLNTPLPTHTNPIPQDHSLR